MINNSEPKRSIHQKLDLLYQLLRTGFKLRYNDSLLGIVWVILKPLINFTVLYLVFSNFKALDVPHFEVYLLLGIIVYSYFSESILSGAGSLLGMAHIILKVQFPKEIAVLSAQGLALISLFINLLILIVFSVVSKVDATILSVLYFAFLMITLTIMCYGISLFTSILTVRLRDMTNLLEVFLQMGFYLTPIIYPLTILPARLQSIVLMNPMSTFVIASRNAIVNGTITNTTEVSMIFFGALILILVGQLFFKRYMKRVAEFY